MKRRIAISALALLITLVFLCSCASRRELCPAYGNTYYKERLPY